MNDDYETSIENFEIEDDQNLICDHDDMIYEEIKCEICEKVFKTKILLKNHLETDKGENVTCNDFELKIIKIENDPIEDDKEGQIHTAHEYKCESCGKLFSQADHLKRHIHKLHKSHRDYKCEDCGKSFSELKSIFTQFMKAVKNTNVNLVVNYFLLGQI